MSSCSNISQLKFLQTGTNFWIKETDLFFVVWIMSVLSCTSHRLKAYTVCACWFSDPDSVTEGLSAIVKVVHLHWAFYIPLPLPLSPSVRRGFGNAERTDEVFTKTIIWSTAFFKAAFRSVFQPKAGNNTRTLGRKRYSDFCAKLLRNHTVQSKLDPFS